MKTTNFSPAILPVQLQELHRNFTEQPNTDTARALTREYFMFFGTGVIKEELWRMLAGTLSDPEMPGLEEGVKRYNLIFFYEFTLIFMQAANWLAKEKREEG